MQFRDLYIDLLDKVRKGSFLCHRDLLHEPISDYSWPSSLGGAFSIRFLTSGNPEGHLDHLNKQFLAISEKLWKIFLLENELLAKHREGVSLTHSYCFFDSSIPIYELWIQFGILRRNSCCQRGS